MVTYTYMTYNTLRTLCRKIMALPIMPRYKISSGFDEIREVAADSLGLPIMQLLQYFENHFMSDSDLWHVCQGDVPS